MVRWRFEKYALFAEPRNTYTGHIAGYGADAIYMEKPMRELSASRANHEILHGRKLAAGHAETTWGWGTPAGKQRASRRAAMIAHGARLGPGVRALEIGCGTGLFTECFALSGAEIVAVDI